MRSRVELLERVRELNVAPRHGWGEGLRGFEFWSVWNGSGKVS